MNIAVKLGVYTTFFPAFMPFVGNFIESIYKQTDKDFTLVVALDGLKAEDFPHVENVPLRLLEVPAGLTISQVREWAWQQVIHEFDALVFCDGDDVLAPSRIEHARRSLLQCDLDACALALVDESLKPLHATLSPDSQKIESLPQSNVFGLSNTAYRTSLLRQIFPLPIQVDTVDWYMAAVSVALQARIHVRPEEDMFYRQHGRNMAGPMLPMDAVRVETGTRISLVFLKAMLENKHLDGYLRQQYQQRLNSVVVFQKAIVAVPNMLNTYVSEFNKMKVDIQWWNAVAHPSLQDMWQKQ